MPRRLKEIRIASVVALVSRGLRLGLRDWDYLGIVEFIAFVIASGCGAPSPKASAPPKPITTMASSGCGALSLGICADFNGLLPFSGDNAWNQDVSSQPSDPDSPAIIGYISASAPLHADFNDRTGGIPYIVVDSSMTPLVRVSLAEPGQSDVFPMPIPLNAPIEAGTDHHVIVIDRKTCWLYEFWEAAFRGGGWTANNAAVWNLRHINERPYTWTSADAAGLPILPGLVRYDEVASGEIHHALRFTVPRTTAAFVAPATHWAPTNRDSPIPMGMRLRLKASFDISDFSRGNQVLLTAMKKYGLIVADNGTEMYVSGAPDSRWSNFELRELHKVKTSDFEVVKMPTKITDANVPTGHPPQIASFTASPKVLTKGSQTTLQWTSSDASYFYINPFVGVVRADHVTVSPAETTTYQLTATGPYGRSIATVIVEVK
ncbi:MAG: hypothetical protein WBE13_05870 [Candidatus Acidiferrum sp.]